MQFPLDLSFKIMALAPQISVTDAGGQLVLYVKQKGFKLKEAVTVFADQAQTMPLYTIQADRVLDISARYNFADQNQITLGAVKRDGLKSLWKARYAVLHDEMNDLTIREENGWVKVMDSVVGEIPILGFFTGYLFHPAYLVERPDGTTVMRLEKQPAFFEGKFKLEKLAEMDEAEETRAMLSLLMMILLERSRG